MKRVVLIGVMLVALASLVGCDLAGEEGREIEVHLQSGFEGERVSVMLDGERVFDGNVATDETSGLAEIIELRSDEGRHVLQVEVEGFRANLAIS